MYRLKQLKTMSLPYNITDDVWDALPYSKRILYEKVYADAIRDDDRKIKDSSFGEMPIPDYQYDQPDFYNPSHYDVPDTGDTGNDFSFGGGDGGGGGADSDF